MTVVNPKSTPVQKVINANLTLNDKISNDDLLDRKAFNANLLVVHWSEHMIDHKKIYLIQKCPCLSNQPPKKKKKKKKKKQFELNVKSKSTVEEYTAFLRMLTTRKITRLLLLEVFTLTIGRTLQQNFPLRSSQIQ